MHVMKSHHLHRYLRALWRDTRVLVRQFRVSLIALASLEPLAHLREMSGEQRSPSQGGTNSPRRRPWTARLFSRGKTSSR